MFATLCVDPSWQKDFGARELYNTGRGRCVNAQVFSLFKKWDNVITDKLYKAHLFDFSNHIYLSTLHNAFDVFDLELTVHVYEMCYTT